MFLFLLNMWMFIAYWLWKASCLQFVSEVIVLWFKPVRFSQVLDWMWMNM